MALEDQGKKTALNAIAEEGVKITLYGAFSPGYTEEDLTPQSFQFEETSPGSGEYARQVEDVIWTIISDSSVTFEITSELLAGESFTAQGIKILDVNDDVLIKKALASNVTFDDPGEFVVESYTLTIPN
jgi:hypothetical protein